MHLALTPEQESLRAELTAYFADEPRDFLAVATAAGHEVARLAAEGEGPLFQINLFWVIISAVNFVIFFVLIWTFALKPVSVRQTLFNARNISHAHSRYLGFLVAR